MQSLAMPPRESHMPLAQASLHLGSTSFNCCSLHPLRWVSGPSNEQPLAVAPHRTLSSHVFTLCALVACLPENQYFLRVCTERHSFVTAQQPQGCSSLLLRTFPTARGMPAAPQGLAHTLPNSSGRACCAPYGIADILPDAG